MKRVLVARAPRFDRETRKLSVDGAIVGLLRWTGEMDPPEAVRTTAYAAGKSWLTIVIKSSARSVAAGPPQWSTNTPFSPDDFVPWRSSVDILLRGEVPPGPFRVVAGKFQRSLHAAMGVSGPTLSNDAGAPLAPHQPPPLTPLGRGRHGVEPASGDAFQRASDRMRALLTDLGDEVVVDLADGSRRTWRLPAARPRVVVYASTEGGEDREVEPAIDTLVLDFQEDQLQVVWRAALPTLRLDARDVDKIVVGFAPLAPDYDVRDILRELPRGEFGWAWELEDVERGELPPPLDGEELEIARYETWDAPEGPLPAIPLASYATIAAELAEQREPRDRVLARHDLDAYRWDVEDRAWAEAMAEPPPDDDDPREAIAEGYARLFVEAQDRLATPEEAAITAEKYADLSVAMETEEPPKVLAAAGMGLGAFQRLDRRMRTRAAAEPAFAEELEELMRRRRSPEPPDDASQEDAS